MKNGVHRAKSFIDIFFHFEMFTLEEEIEDNLLGYNDDTFTSLRVMG